MNDTPDTSTHQPPTQVPTFLEELFLEMLSSEQGASSATLEAYGRDLKDWTLFLKPRRPTDASPGYPR